jgi:hypothetical protein
MALPIVELLCDKPTCWDSTYIMFNNLRILRQVSLISLDSSHSLTLAQAINHWIDLPAQCSIACYKLSPMDWQVLQDLEVILEVCFHMYKTSNIFTILH